MLDLIAVLSPHLDDAVLSLGAAIATWPAPVRIVTVLAGDPDAAEPAGAWDRASGFQTQGEATAARREEDRRACRAVGADPVWLPFGDEQYRRGADDERIWGEIVEAVGGSTTVLTPGHPLTHRDHRWLSELVLRAREPSWRFGLYLEQPYALGGSVDRRQVPAAASLVGDEAGALRFRPVPAGAAARRRKRRACRAYASQLGQLAEAQGTTPRGLVRRIGRFERVRGGEQVAWLQEGR